MSTASKLRAQEETRGLRFFVPGVAKPAGSKKAFVNKRTGRAIITDDCVKSKDWKASVAQAASEALSGPLLSGPLNFHFLFVFARPAGQFGKGRRAALVKDSAPRFPAVKPDTTKLVRATEDACNGILWKDDAQIVDQRANKIYGERPGVHITVWPADEPPEEPDMIRMAD